MVAVAITRDDYGPSELRVLAARARAGNVARRLLALALVLEGVSRGAAARAAGMDRQTLRDWVHRYNEAGVEGLANRVAPGPRPSLTPEQTQQLAEWVRNGPDPARDGVVRWRRRDLAARIAQEFGVTLAERSVGALLRRLAFTRLSVRPQHPLQDPEAIETHKKTSPSSYARRSPAMPATNPSNSGGRMRRGSASKAR